MPLGGVDSNFTEPAEFKPKVFKMDADTTGENNTNSSGSSSSRSPDSPLGSKKRHIDYDNESPNVSDTPNDTKRIKRYSIPRPITPTRDTSVLLRSGTLSTGSLPTSLRSLPPITGRDLLNN